MDNKNYMCPMLSGAGYVNCMKAACAWWDSKEEKCAVAHLDTVASCLQRICEDGITTYPT